MILNYSHFLYSYGSLIIMNLYISWRDSLVPQTSYVLNSLSVLLFCLYLFSQANNQFIATSRECEHVLTYRTAQTATHWIDKCHAPASSPRSGRWGHYHDKKDKEQWILWRQPCSFFECSFSSRYISPEISHIQQGVTLWTKMFSSKHCGSGHLVYYSNMYSWPNEAE